MTYKVVKKYCVIDPKKGGTTQKGRCFASKQKAIRQAFAINASVMKKP
jgi:hypothetical protein